MKTWRLILNPEKVQGDEKGQAVLFDYCISNKILGLGWAIDPAPTDKLDYVARAKESHGRAVNSAVRFVNKCEVNDTIWITDGKDKYVSCIVGEWKYVDDSNAKKFGIQNQREILSLKEFDGKGVPRDVKTALTARPARTFQKCCLSR